MERISNSPLSNRFERTLCFEVYVTIVLLTYYYITSVGAVTISLLASCMILRWMWLIMDFHLPGEFWSSFDWISGDRWVSIWRSWRSWTNWCNWTWNWMWEDPNIEFFGFGPRVRALFALRYGGFDDYLSDQLETGEGELTVSQWWYDDDRRRVCYQGRVPAGLELDKWFNRVVYRKSDPHVSPEGYGYAGQSRGYDKKTGECYWAYHVGDLEVRIDYLEMTDIIRVDHRTEVDTEFDDSDDDSSSESSTSVLDEENGNEWIWSPRARLPIDLQDELWTVMCFERFWQEYTIYHQPLGSKGFFRMAYLGSHGEFERFWRVIDGFGHETSTRTEVGSMYQRSIHD